MVYSFKQGGLTQGQIEILYEGYQKRKLADLKIQASLKGINLDEKLENNTPKTKTEIKKETFVFGDPEDYKNLTDEEKHNLTEEMMVRHRKWANERKDIGAE